MNHLILMNKDNAFIYYVNEENIILNAQENDCI